MYGCFDPKRIVNPYTRKVLYVDCRNCDYCRNKRSYELSERIEREFVASANNDVMFFYLDYNNTHLPVYTRGNDGRWWSNRERGLSDDKRRLPSLENEQVQEYYHPVRYWRKDAFAHLYYPDVRKWLDRVKALLRYEFGLLKHTPQRSEEVERLFQGLEYEDVNFRYFLCGEYGPVTFRPHYHIILFFSRRYTAEQSAYLAKVLSSCWSYGTADIEPVTTRGVKNYVANYVTSTVGLPEVLRIKPLRPFCTFSKAPAIGSYSLDKSTLWEMLTTGVTTFSEWSDKEKQFVDVSPASSLYSRYFPRCSRFGYETDTYKLRVYSYVYNYYRGLQLERATRIAREYGFTGRDYDCCVEILSSVPYHTEDEVNRLRLVDIPDSLFPLSPSVYKHSCDGEVERIGEYVELHYTFGELRSMYDEFVSVTRSPISYDSWLRNMKDRLKDNEQRITDWSYLDMYASLVCYRYCVVFGITPRDVLDSIERVYSVRAMDALKALYDAQEEMATKQILPYY